MSTTPYSLKGKIAGAIRALRPALLKQFLLRENEGQASASEKGHKQAVVEQLAVAIGRKLPSPQHDQPGDETETKEEARDEYRSSDEVSPEVSYKEGATTQITVNAYERNAKAREACIARYGTA